MLARTFCAPAVVVLITGCMAETEGNPKPGHSQQQAVAAADLHVTIRRVGSDVEVEVTAPEPFPDRAMPPVLIIGDKAFGRSRSPSDGRTDTLIFTIPSQDFDALADNSDVSLSYLSSAARLSPEPAAGTGNAASAAKAEPRIRPDQAEAKRRRAGTFRKSQEDVLP